MIKKARMAGLIGVLTIAAVVLFAVLVPVPMTATATVGPWSITRVGSSINIDPSGQINLAPVSGQAVAASRLFNANGGVSVPTAKTAVVTDADALTVGGVIVPQKLVISYRCGAAATCVSSSFFIADAAYQITAVNAVWGTAESTASNLRIQVEKLTGTTAAGSGTALLTNNTNAGISIKGTANTVTAGTLTATTANLQLAAGDRVGIKYEGAATEGASVVVTVTLKRI